MRESTKHETDAAPRVFACNCAHPYQDGRYGKGNRLHNPRKVKGGHGKAWRCTVCGDIKER